MRIDGNYKKIISTPKFTKMRNLKTSSKIAKKRLKGATDRKELQMAS